MEAVKARDEGKSAKEIAEIMTNTVPRVRSQFIIDRFDWVRSNYTQELLSKYFTMFNKSIITTDDETIDFNRKEDLTKNFDEITKKLFNQKKILMLLMVQMNISLIIKKVLETTRDQRVIELISFLHFEH